jgi:hypothetical protein
MSEYVTQLKRIDASIPLELPKIGDSIYYKPINLNGEVFSLTKFNYFDKEVFRVFFQNKPVNNAIELMDILTSDKFLDYVAFILSERINDMDVKLTDDYVKVIKERVNKLDQFYNALIEVSENEDVRLERISIKNERIAQEIQNLIFKYSTSVNRFLNPESLIKVEREFLTELISYVVNKNR